MQISANTAQLAQAVQDVNKRLDEMGSAGKKAADDLGTLKNIEIAKLAIGGITAATTAFVSLAGAVTNAAAGITNFALAAGRELDALNDVANRTGVGVEALQAYSQAAAQNGIEIASFAKQIQKLTINIGKATISEKEQEKFEKLGITFAELKASTPEKQFEMIVDALSQIADPAERAATAVKFFGKGGIELGELFTQGPGYLEAIRKDTESLGGIIREDAVKSIDSMFDSFGKVQTIVGNLAKQVLGELAGPLGTIAEDLLELVKATGPQRIAQNIAAGLLSFIELAGNAFFELAKFIEGFVTKYGKILGIETRSDSQQQRDNLVAQRDQLQKIVDAGGETFVRRLALGVRQATPEDRVKLQELNATIAALPEQNQSALASAATNFREAIGAARSSINERLQPPSVPGGAPVPVQIADTTAEGANDEQTKLLGDIARNTKPATVVELPR